MRKLKVYLDTSVVSYLYQVDAPEKMQNTLDLWDLFRNKRNQRMQCRKIENIIGLSGTDRL